MKEIIKENEIINFNGNKYRCCVNELHLPQILTKRDLKFLCYSHILKRGE